MERNLSEKARTDFSELRSSSKRSTLADGVVFRISCFASVAASMFLAAMMTWAPRSAKTLAVSAPMPLAPPVDVTVSCMRLTSGSLSWREGSIPVMMTVRLDASTPSVTCSAVEDDPKPLGPGNPVTSEKIPMKASLCVDELGGAIKRKKGTQQMYSREASHL